MSLLLFSLFLVLLLLFINNDNPINEVMNGLEGHTNIGSSFKLASSSAADLQQSGFQRPRANGSGQFERNQYSRCHLQRKGLSKYDVQNGRRTLGLSKVPYGLLEFFFNLFRANFAVGQSNLPRNYSAMVNFFRHILSLSK